MHTDDEKLGSKSHTFKVCKVCSHREILYVQIQCTTGTPKMLQKVKCGTMDL